MASITATNSLLFETDDPKHMLNLNYHKVSYAYVVVAIMYVYDLLLTLGGEIEMIWKRRFTLPTILYILLRYLTLVVMILSIGVLIPQMMKAMSCQVLMLFMGVGNLCIVCLISAIMSLRILALYNRTKYMAIILALINIGQMAIYINLLDNTKFHNTEPDNGQSCNTSAAFASSVRIVSLWWTPLVVDTVLFVLTVVRLYWLRRRIGSLSPLLHVIQGDGISYYILICTVYVLNVFNFTFNVGAFKMTGLFFTVAIPAITACRLTRNLQRLSPESHSHQYGGGTVSGDFTTAPSRVEAISINASIWLTGEQWDQIQNTAL